MNGDSTMNNEVLDPHLTTKIVSSYVRHHMVGADQVSDLITSVHRALGQLGQPVEPREVLTPAVSVRRSVHHDYVVCLDCGYRGKTLRRHITTRHGLSRDDYLKRWKLKSDHPLTAPSYTETEHPIRIEISRWSRWSSVAVRQEKTTTFSVAPREDNPSPVEPT